MLDTSMVATNISPNHIYVMISGGSNVSGAEDGFTIVGGNRTLKANVWEKVSIRFKTKDTTEQIFFKFHLFASSLSIVKWLKNVSVREGSEELPWHPSSSEINYNTQSPTIYKTNILLSEPLRSVGDVKDRLFLDTDGLWKVERNVGEHTFTDHSWSQGQPTGGWNVSGETLPLSFNNAEIIVLSGNLL